MTVTKIILSHHFICFNTVLTVLFNVVLSVR